MQVYGDAVRREAVAHKLDRLRGQWSAAQAAPAGIARHGLCVDALIETGELTQGIADARFEEAGQCDARRADVDAAMALTLALARACVRSWHGGFAQRSDDDAVAAALKAARLPDLPIDVKQPEGYAFYALYPEGYFAAAQRLQGAGPWRVIGLRSIGTSLAAMVACALGDGAPVTLRPVGHPFDRRVAWTGASLAVPGAHHAIVDEGPGLSGSTVAGVVRHLRDEGVAPERIHVFAGHANGPGAQASDETRALWAQTATHVVGFDALSLHAHDAAHRLQGWVEALVGPLLAPLEEITGGGWRRAHRGAEHLPAHPWQERRKFMAHTGDGAWLVKFIGLGHAARERYDCARALAAAGFSPEVAGLCHGFIVMRWHATAVPMCALQLEDPALRARLVERVADYIGFRAKHFPVSRETGASLAALHAMGRHNSLEALGAGASAAWDRLGHGLAACEARVRPVRTDNRMHAWEWLADGTRLLKTDAVDHHAGHDLVGCQDPAWDVAGAIAELAFSPGEAHRLVAQLAQRGCPIDAALLGFCQAAYLAFQLGHFTLAADDAVHEAERARLAAHATRYAQALQRQLALCV